MEEKISLILDGMENIKFHCDMRYCDRESCKKQVGDLIRLHFGDPVIEDRLDKVATKKKQVEYEFEKRKQKKHEEKIEEKTKGWSKFIEYEFEKRKEANNSNETITELWDKILELRGVTDDSISVELDDHGFLWIRDWYPVSLDDARVILKHKIPKDMFYEYADMKTGNCRSDRIKTKIEEDVKFLNISLEDFYLYFGCE